MIHRVVESLAKRLLHTDNYIIADTLASIINSFESEELVDPQTLQKFQQDIYDANLHTYDDDGLSEGIFNVIVAILNDIDTTSDTKIISIIDALYDDYDDYDDA